MAERTETMSTVTPSRAAPERTDERTAGVELPPKPLTKQGRATRQRLIEAAMEEFGAVGYVAARVEAITARAGFGYGTFYNYFASKVDLIRTVAEEVYGELFDPMLRPPGPTVSVAQRMFDNILDYMKICHRHRRDLLVLDDAVGSDPSVASRVESLRERYAEAWGDRMVRRLGYHPVADPVLVGRITNSLGHDIVVRFIRSELCTGDPEADLGELESLARIATVMTMAAVDPGSLGVDPERLHEIMENVEPSQGV